MSKGVAVCQCALGEGTAMMTIAVSSGNENGVVKRMISSNVIVRNGNKMHVRLFFFRRKK